ELSHLDRELLVLEQARRDAVESRRQPRDVEPAGRSVRDDEQPPACLRHRAPEALVSPAAVDPRGEDLAGLGRGLRAALLVEPERLAEMRVQAAVVDQADR